MTEPRRPSQPARRRRRRPGRRRASPPPLAPVPTPTYPAELPIAARREEIVRAIREHPVVVVTGATGSGKTTQLPKMCLEAGRGRIACTQPRRIAAITVAARVAEELGPAGPDLVGYKIRFADRTGPATRIKFVTDGMLLAETQGDPELAAYDTVIVDEAHERSLNIDFLLGILKRLLARRTDLRVVITSATIDTEKFARAFGGAPVIAVPGRTHPVEVRYRPIAPEDEDAGDVTYVDQAVGAVMELHREGRREDVLVFMPTERDVAETVEALERQGPQGAVVLPLYGRLPGRAQGRVFQSVRGQKIVVATNVAETSVTVPGIRHVVDTGLARIPTYNPRTRTHRLPIRPVSRSSADQRRGRCGRLGPGVCIRLYAEEDYERRPEFTAPEIQRANLAEVILRMTALGLGDPAAFPFVDPPAPRAVRDGLATLVELGAVDARRHLTPAGRVMARLPLDPRVARMLLEADRTGALREVAIVAAALSVQDPRDRPAEKRAEADAAHARFRAPDSDFLGYLKLWDAYHDTLEEMKSQGRMRRFCREHFLSFPRMREWRDVHEQIVGVLDAEGFALDRGPADEAAIHKAILSGHLRHVGLRKERNLYLGAHNKVFTVFPGSALAKKGGTWIVAGELVETSRLFARTVAAIEPEWLEELGGSLCRRSYAEPHWEKNRGQVVATERVTLFGLPIVTGRRVDYGRVDRAGAREIFIRSALVEGEIKGAYGFLAHNRELLASLEDVENRLRRRGVVPDEESLFAFYDARVGDLCDQRSFNRALRVRGSDDFLRLREEDLVGEEPGSGELEPFPDALRVDGVDLPLAYRFEPGCAEDGVTVTVPAALTSGLDPGIFEWLVPGLLAEKVTLLVKGLPKALRRPLVPVPRTVEELLDELPRPRGSLHACLEDLLRRRFRLRVGRSDWPVAALPPHLIMRYRVVGAGGEVLAETRDFARARAAAASGPEAGGATDLLAAARARWERADLTAYDFPAPPERIPLGAETFAFPALVRQEDGRVALRLFATPEEAETAGPAGLRALYAAHFGGELSVLRKDLALPRDRWPLFEGLGGRDAVARDLLDFVLSEVFAVGDGRIPERAAFRARVEALKGGGLFRRAREVWDAVLDVLAERRQTLDLLAKLGRRSRVGGAGRLAVFRRELDRLVPKDFLRTTDPARLADLARYVRALRVRIERADLAPAKDAEKEARLAPHEERLAAARGHAPAAPEGRRRVEEFAAMIEEFRVSLFAQELGTAVPVSAKRLEKKWDELRRELGI